MFGTKTDAGKASHQSFIELVDRAMRIRREKAAGYPRDLNRMSNMEFESYLIVDEMCDFEDIAHRAKLENMIMVGFKLKQE